MRRGRGRGKSRSAATPKPVVDFHPEGAEANSITQEIPRQITIEEKS